MTIEELIKKAHTQARKSGWWAEAQYSRHVDVLGCKLLAIHGEVSEAYEALARNIPDFNPATTAQGAKPEGLTVELADILIRVCDLAGYLNLPLEKAVEAKTEYNATRSHRHGNKKL